MNRWQKEVQQSLLKDEESVIRNLERGYQSALDEINNKIAEYTTRIQMGDNVQSAIYQKQYQEQLKAQIEASIQMLHSGNYTTINNYLTDSYKNAYAGTFYDMQKQGVPLVIPINQEDMIRAITLNSKISEGLYKKLGVDTQLMKKRITAEVTRGIASGSSWEQIAKQIGIKSGVTYTNAVRIARTEGHRIQQASSLDAMKKASKKGADIVKQWDATLDGKTRSTHRALDGQIVNINDKFKSEQGDVEAPGMFGLPSEDCNCRCCLLQRASWMLKEQIDPDTGEVTYTDGDGFTKFDGNSNEIVDFSDAENYNDFRKSFWEQCKKIKKEEKLEEAKTSIVDLSSIRKELKELGKELQNKKALIRQNEHRIRLAGSGLYSDDEIEQFKKENEQWKSEIEQLKQTRAEKGKVVLENMNSTFKFSSDDDELISYVLAIDEKVDYKEVMKLSSKRTSEEIISVLAGGDKTGGSCASVGLAYMGQKQGFDVLDFRGGDSWEFFHSSFNLNELANLNGMKVLRSEGASSITVGNRLLKQVEVGKEYYLCVGKHASIVRKTEDGVLQYLELQSSNRSGWTNFNGNPKYTLHSRFGCTQTSSSSSMYDFMIDMDSSNLNTNEFRTILGYINTNESEQRKGLGGTIK